MWVVAGLLMVLTWPGRPALAEDPPASVLRYGERPLKSSDFRAPVPDERPAIEPRIEAFSHTEVRYQYQLRTRRRSGRWQAEIQSIDVEAVFIPEKSWNAQPGDARLLDHHQGHFDLAQIAALAVQSELDHLQRARRLPVGRGTSEASAQADLEMQIARLVRGHTDALQRDHDYFDQITRYGTLADVEARERQQQQETLRRRMSHAE